MRLINVKTLRVEEFLEEDAPKYAILSHTWSSDNEELTLRDVNGGNLAKSPAGLSKVKGCCRLAEERGLAYAWIDTCCIDKTNSSELSEAINSMYNWYKLSTICYVFLADVSDGLDPRNTDSQFRNSRWFRRGWTLQELLAPKTLHFHDQHWKRVGTKTKLSSLLAEITGVPRQFLLGLTGLSEASIAQRMCWAANRETKRKEDRAYSLLGLFGIAIPLIYGEGGEQAFLRLQRRIMEDAIDDSILAWGLSGENETPNSTGPRIPGTVLARNPSDFAMSGRISARGRTNLTIAGGGLDIDMHILSTTDNGLLGLLRCGPEHDEQRVVAIPLQTSTSSEYARTEGAPAILLTPVDSPEPIRTILPIRSTTQAGNLQGQVERFWLLDPDQLEDLDMKIVETFPESCGDNDLGTLKPHMSDDPATLELPVWARLRQSNGLMDFVLALWFEQQDQQVMPHCCAMVCSSNADLQNMAEQLDSMVRQNSKCRVTSNGDLNICVVLEPVGRHPIFNVILEEEPKLAKDVINASVEVEKIELAGESQTLLMQTLAHIEPTQKLKSKKDEVETVQQERETIEEEIAALQERARMLLAEEMSALKELAEAEQAQTEALERQRNAHERWPQVRARFNELLDANPRDEDVDLETMTGQEALIRAVQNNQIEIVKLILDMGVKQSDVTKPDADGLTPLMMASNLGHAEIVLLLVGRSMSQVDSTDAGVGRAVLSWAAEKGHENIVQVLLDTGKVDFKTKDHRGDTPLALAIENGHSSVQKLLRKRLHQDETLSVERTANSTATTKKDGSADKRIWVLSVDFSGNGRYILSTASDSTIRIREANTREHQRMFTYTPRNDPNARPLVFTPAIFSPDSKLFAAASYRYVCIFDAETLECLEEIEDNTTGLEDRILAWLSNKTLVFSRDDNVMAITSLTYKEFGLHDDPGDGFLAFRLVLREKSTDIRVSDRCWWSFPKDVGVMKVSAWQSVEAWSGHEPRSIFTDHQRSFVLDLAHKVPCSALSPRSKYMATGSLEGGVSIWNLTDRAVLATLLEDRSCTRAIVFSPDGNFLAERTTSRISLWVFAKWDSSGWRLLQTFSVAHLVSCDYSLAFSPDSLWLVYASDESLKLAAVRLTPRDNDRQSSSPGKGSAIKDAPGTSAIEMADSKLEETSQRAESDSPRIEARQNKSESKDFMTQLAEKQYKPVPKNALDQFAARLKGKPWGP